MKRSELRVVDGPHTHAFATGGLIEALQAAGAPTEEAVRVVRDVEKRVRASGARVVSSEELVAQIEAAVATRVGRDVAEAFGRQTSPFVPLEIERDDSVTRFERSKLAASFEKAGISFKEANLLALQVERALRADGLRRVPERELVHRAALAVGSRYGREALLRYEAAVAQSGELIVVERDGVGFPYSRGILAQSLMAIGLGPERSHNLAKRIEEVLWQGGEERVTRVQVRDAAHAVLLTEAGEEYARRYLVMRRVRARERPLVVVIGGSAGVGKSVLAAQLAYRLGISRVVSTDSIRQALRSLIGPELSPVLHASSFTAWQAELLPEEIKVLRPERKNVIRGFRSQLMQLATAVDAIIERQLVEGTSVVVEGVHLVPGLSPRVREREAVVVEMVLAVDDEDDHRENFGRREGRTSPRRPSAEYLEHFREIRILQGFMVAQARREAVSVVDSGDLDRAVDRAIEVVLDAVMAEGEGDASEAGPRDASADAS